jgi:hypothetical protein
LTSQICKPKQFAGPGGKLEAGDGLQILRKPKIFFIAAALFIIISFGLSPRLEIYLSQKPVPVVKYFAVVCLPCATVV